MESVFAGNLSGIAQIIVGHPFDTYKTWKQTKSKNKINLNNLYKGIKYPLYTNIFINGIMFGGNNYISQYTTNEWISGALIGIVSGIFLCPIDLYKIRAQVDLKTPSFYKLSKGLNITILREILACSIYFGAYKNINDEINNSFISGGIAGSLSWGLIHPIDTIKTRIQSNQVKSIKQGIYSKNLWNGLSASIYRAFIVNSVGFWVYHSSFDIIKNMTI